jgi:ribokinase
MEPGSKPIVVVGSLNIDLVVHAGRIPAAGETLTGEDFQVHPGGKGGNQAVAVARLGYPVQMIGRVGNDDFGRRLLGQLSEAGVDARCVASTETSTGVAMIVVTPEGENSIVVSPGANASLRPADLDANLEEIRSAGIVLAQLEIPVETVLHLARLCAREGVPLVLDPAPAAELPEELTRAVAWFTPNETEAAFYRDVCWTGDESPAEIVQRLAGRGLRNIVLKMGNRGVYVATADGKSVALSSFAVEAVDTTGAGDCFNGAFATGLMLGKDVLESARFASAAAALSVARPGAQPSMPSRPEVDEFLRGQGRN